MGVFQLKEIVGEVARKNGVKKSLERNAVKGSKQTFKDLMRKLSSALNKENEAEIIKSSTQKLSSLVKAVEKSVNIEIAKGEKEPARAKELISFIKNRADIKFEKSTAFMPDNLSKADEGESAVEADLRMASDKADKSDSEVKPQVTTRYVRSNAKLAMPADNIKKNGKNASWISPKTLVENERIVNNGKPSSKADVDQKADVKVSHQYNHVSHLPKVKKVNTEESQPSHAESKDVFSRRSVKTLQQYKTIMSDNLSKADEGESAVKADLRMASDKADKSDSEVKPQKTTRYVRSNTRLAMPAGNIKKNGKNVSWISPKTFEAASRGKRLPLSKAKEESVADHAPLTNKPDYIGTQDDIHLKNTVKILSGSIHPDRIATVSSQGKVHTKRLNKDKANSKSQSKPNTDLEVRFITSNEDPEKLQSEEKIGGFENVKVVEGGFAHQRAANDSDHILQGIVNELVSISKKIRLLISDIPSGKKRKAYVSNHSKTVLSHDIKPQMVKEKKIINSLQITIMRKTNTSKHRNQRIIHEIKSSMLKTIEKLKNSHGIVRHKNAYFENSDGSLKDRESAHKSFSENALNTAKSYSPEKAYMKNEEVKSQDVNKPLNIKEAFNRIVQTIVKRSNENNFTEVATMKLHPPKLGEMEVIITKEGNNVEIKFKVFGKDAQDAIEKSLHLLSDRLSSHGFSVEKIEVTQESKNFYNENYKEDESQEGEYQEGEKEKKQREQKREGKSDDDK